jgi:hypothetical protein
MSELDFIMGIVAAIGVGCIFSIFLVLFRFGDLFKELNKNNSTANDENDV